MIAQFNNCVKKKQKPNAKINGPIDKILSKNKTQIKQAESSAGNVPFAFSFNLHIHNPIKKNFSFQFCFYPFINVKLVSFFLFLFSYCIRGATKGTHGTS